MNDGRLIVGIREGNRERMAKALVIVESPAKARTINKYLGVGFKVVASMGHIRDLPKNRLGVDVAAGFVPEYVEIPARKKVVSELRAAARGISDIYVATDPSGRARRSAGTWPGRSARANGASAV